MRGTLRKFKPTAVAAAAGAAGTYAAGMAAQKLPPMLTDAWWKTPLLVALAGHFLKRKSHDAGMGLVGAAGAIAAMQFQTRGLTAPQQAKGFDDLAALQEASAYDAAAYYSQNAGILGEASGDFGDMVNAAGSGEMAAIDDFG